MPIVYHSTDTNEIKKELNTIFNINLEGVKVKTIENPTNENIYFSILDQAIEICRQNLPVGIFDFLNTKDELSKINETKKQKILFSRKENLLRYVFMDALLNLQKNCFVNLDTKQRYIQSQRQFFSDSVVLLQSQSENSKETEPENQTVQTNDFENAYANFNGLFNSSRNMCWFNELYDFYLPKQIPKANKKSKGIGDKAVSPYMAKLLGVLIYQSKKVLIINLKIKKTTIVHLHQNQ